MNLPTAIEAEMLVLGSFIGNPEALQFLDLLEVDDFYGQDHKEIFLKIKKLNPNVDTFLVAQGLPDFISFTYPMQLVETAGTSVHVEEYIAMIKRFSAIRKVIEITTNALADAYRHPEHPDKFRDDIVKKLNAIESGVHSQKTLCVSEMLRQCLADKPDRISTGYPELNSILNGGFAQGNLIILAARPGVGKTALALNIAHACLKNDVKIGIFSLEMSETELAHRLTMLVLGRPFQYGLLSDNKYKIIERAANQLTGDRIYINDTPSQSVSELCLRARKMVQAGARLLIVDYMQLLGGPAGESRYQIVSEISRRLKMLAGQLRVPILCLSQLSRKIEERNNRRPQLSDLRESGSIEQDADVVMFITRDDSWGDKSEYGEAELLIAKNRSGSVGDIRMKFEKEIMRFTSP